MTGYAIFLEVSRHLLVGCVGLEECPSPSIAPQTTIWESVLFVLDHHEPLDHCRGPIRITCGHLSVISSVDFFYQYGSICKLSILPVILRRSRRRVDHVQLISRRIKNRPRSKCLIVVSVVSWLANISCLVYQFIAVEAAGIWGAAGLLRVDEPVARQDDEREDDK